VTRSGVAERGGVDAVILSTSVVNNNPSSSSFVTTATTTSTLTSTSTSSAVARAASEMPQLMLQRYPTPLPHLSYDAVLLCFLFSVFVPFENRSQRLD
jgi:hypothetical protein